MWSPWSQRDDIAWASGLALVQPQGHRAFGGDTALSLLGGACGRVQTEGSVCLCAQDVSYYLKLPVPY